MNLPARSAAAAYLATAAILAAGEARAQGLTWQVSSGDWSLASNWGGTLPTGTDAAFIVNGGTANRTQLGETYGTLALGSGAGRGTVLMTAGNLTATSYEYLGNSGKGTFTQSGGANAVGTELDIGYNTGSSGTYNLSGSGLLAQMPNGRTKHDSRVLRELISEVLRLRCRLSRARGPRHIVKGALRTGGFIMDRRSSPLLALALLAVLVWTTTSAENPTKPQSPRTPASVESLGGGDRYLTYVSTDKPIYRPGESLFVRAVPLHYITRKPIAAAQALPATVEIKGPKGDTVASGVARLQECVYGFSWAIPPSQAGGERSCPATGRRSREVGAATTGRPIAGTGRRQAREKSGQSGRGCGRTKRNGGGQSPGKA
jgi:hypothetical protein